MLKYLDQANSLKIESRVLELIFLRPKIQSIQKFYTQVSLLLKSDPLLSWAAAEKTIREKILKVAIKLNTIRHNKRHHSFVDRFPFTCNAIGLLEGEDRNFDLMVMRHSAK